MSVETLKYFGSHSAKAEVSPTARLSAVLVNVFGTLFVWMERVRTRHNLAKLDDRLLHDIGLSRADVSGEIEKPFWVK